MDIWIISIFCLLWIALWTFICKFLFEHLFPIILGAIAGSYGNSMFNSAPFYIPTSKVKGSNFFTSLLKLVIIYFYYSQPSDYEEATAISLWFWYISLMSRDLQQLFMCLSPLAIFWEGLSFVVWVVWVYTFWTPDPYQTYDLKIFSPILFTLFSGLSCAKLFNSDEIQFIFCFFWSHI